MKKGTDKIVLHICSTGLYLIKNKTIKQEGTVQYECYQDKSSMCFCYKSIINDCNWTRTQNHLVRKWTLNHLFIYELSGSGFESSCSHLNFRFRACFEQGVPWHSCNYRVWIHSETRTWHEKNIQSVL